MVNNTIVVLADPTDPQLYLLDVLRKNANVVIGNSVELLERAAGDAIAILNWTGPVSVLRDVLSKSSNIRWIHTRSAGVEEILFPELVASSITLTNGTGIFSASLSEFVLAAILYFAKGLRRMVRSQEKGAWDPFDIEPIADCIVGILGYGDIGRAVASRVRPIGMRVLAVKRHVSVMHHEDFFVEQVYSPERRLEMLARCDYVVLAAPLTPETLGMISEPELAALKSSAVIINVGRGPVIDERALVKALSTRQIKGAALDVFDREPLPEDHPFYKLDNVLLSPHCADHTHDWLDRAMQLFIFQFERFGKGQPLMNVVDKNLGY